MIQLIQRSRQFPKRVAVQDDGDYSYADLLQRSQEIATCLLGEKTDLLEARIAFLIPGSFEYLAIQWGIWRAGGIAVPLSIHHPIASLRYVLEDTQASCLIVSEEQGDAFASLAQELQLSLMTVPDLKAESSKALPEISEERSAMILYTSGTTSQPKGVVSTHANIESQIQTLVQAWEWQQEDHILCVLPLHHVHGIINVCSCALWSGACVEFQPKFDAKDAFERFLNGRITLFMAVPTIYYKLIAYWKSQNATWQEEVSACLKAFRLMVSGSAALPISVLETWRDISGQTLLERYGMTEIGMAVSNSYRGERRAGHIGLPLPGVDLRLVDEADTPVESGIQGEIQIKGPSVFKEYWQKPEATATSFTEDGWFRTGDIAIFNAGSYRILGRNSVDIIKSGGYKISALEIEEILRTHPAISDCGVVGIPDDEWGEIIVASLVLSGEAVEEQNLTQWLKGHLPSYKIPRRYIYQEDLPRNALGKVTKNELKKCFE
ncbi:MAG: acyl-CoA synthetase [Bacteroidota bacterium]